MIKTATCLLLLAGVATFSGCKKKDNTTTTSTTYMSATVAGKAFSATATNVAAVTDGSSASIVATIPATGENIMLDINKNPPTVGTYTIDNAGNAATYTTSTVVFNSAVSGTITFTSVSPRWEGTFSFTCEDSTTVTNGKFSVVAPK